MRYGSYKDASYQAGAESGRHYICNPEKTDGKLLVSAYGCAAETADIEFAWIRRHAIDKGTNLGRHLIFNAVSFADHKHYHSNKSS